MKYVLHNIHPDAVVCKHFRVGDLRAVIQCNKRIFYDDSSNQGESTEKSFENIQETGLPVSTIPFGMVNLSQKPWNPVASNQTVKNLFRWFGGPKPSKENPNPATCAADSEVLLCKVSLRYFPPGSP